MDKCAETAEMCTCDLPAGHGLPHKCKCGGAWTGDFYGGDFKIYSIPGSSTYYRPEVIE